MKKVLLKSFQNSEVATSIVVMLIQQGVDAELLMTSTSAGVFAKPFDQTDIAVPENQLEKAQQLLKDLEDKHD